MLRRVEEVTLPLRFLSLLTHVLVTLTFIFDMDYIIAARLPDGGSASYWKQTYQGLGWSALAALILEVLILFSGLTAFAAGAQVWLTFTHIIGSSFLGAFILRGWQLQQYTPLAVIFNFLPLAFEVMLALYIRRMGVGYK